MQTQVPSRPVIIGLILLYVVSLLINLGLVPLYLEETRRSFITLEMLFRGDWLVTGDMGRSDADGYLGFVGRSDDLINSSGYRIGPAEIEECLARHPAVALAAVIGVPDEVRGERIKAFLVLKPGVAGDTALEESIRGFVRKHLAAHEAPRDIAFVDALPLTATGKIVRAELRALERSGTGG